MSCHRAAPNTNRRECNICHGLFAPQTFARHQTACKRKIEEEKSARLYRMREAPFETSAFGDTHPEAQGDDPGVGNFESDTDLEPIYFDNYQETFTSMEGDNHTPILEELESEELESEIQLDDIKIEYHPNSGRKPLIVHFDDFGRSEDVNKGSIPPNRTPWHPWRSRMDFEVASLALDCHMNKQKTDKLINLIYCAARGLDAFTLKDHQEIQNTWDLAAERLTKFRKTEVVVCYCDLEPESYELYYRPVWDWLQELLLNRDIVSKMEWDARRLFKFDGGSRTWKRFMEEAWSANSWWSFQSKLPAGAVPLCIVFYADKSKLSSFGTAKGYPVIVRCANLPMDIRNGSGIAGGRVVGWLPIVSEDAAHSGKADFVNFKNVVWHESAAKIFESMAEYCRTGQKALISKADEEAELKKYSLQPCFNSFFKLAHSDPFAGVSFDDLHFQDSGVWGDHIFEHAKIQIDNRSAVTKIDNQFVFSSSNLLYSNKLSVRFKEFPRWSKLNRFDTGVMKLSFNDGSKHYDISRLFLFATHDVIPEKENKAAYMLLKVMRKYINMIMYLGLNVQTSDTIALGHGAIKNFVDMLKVYILLSPDVNKTFNVIKVHYHQHLYDDIENKGVLRGMSTKPNEKFHGPLRKIYLQQTNFKDTAKQIVRFEHQSVVATLIQDEIQILDKYEHGNPELPSDLETPIDNVHFTLGSKLKPVSFAQLEGEDLIFAQIHIRLAEFMLTLLTTATNIVRVTYTAHDTVIPYQFLKICYESLETWRLAVDILRCNPNFHGHPRYDYIIFRGILGPVFAQLHYLLLCNANTR
ncbi:hypothetical protein F5051DRAFT_438442 [Lentinula edodes]|nr:hypothetical protein F5051DRAFT_438442 [Lentinula edodes]